MICSEDEIFSNLATLCSSPGYAHVIAHFCYSSGIIKYEERLKPEDFKKLYSKERIINNELSTLIGLMLKESIDFELPDSEKIEHMIHETEVELKELHECLIHPMVHDIRINKNTLTPNDPHAIGEGLREPIFYCGETAYSFQYLDLSIKKYSNDNEQIKLTKGFYIEEAKEVIECLRLLQNDKFKACFHSFENMPNSPRTLLPAFAFKINEISKYTNMNIDIIQKVVAAFTVPYDDCNKQYKSLNDLNEACIYPIIKSDDDIHILFQHYMLAQALYESPFYWFCDDKTYLNRAMINRGKFTEQFSKERLSKVFGSSKVYSHVIFGESKEKALGEIDALVVFADRAIVLQAKSKRLKIESKKGNDNSIKDDFKLSIQDSYEQALRCSKLLIDKSINIIDDDGNMINIEREISEIYIFCVVADHYPALNFQTYSFLNIEETNKIFPPIIMDVFYLDVLTEFLPTPILFLSFINRRALYYNRVFAENEISILAYHLYKYLWLNDESTSLYLEDDFSVDIDIAMGVRRRNLPGEATPNGILNNLATKPLWAIIDIFDSSQNTYHISLGLFLLQLSEETFDQIYSGMMTLSSLAKSDGRSHDFSMYFSEIKTGLTVHCNDLESTVANEILTKHCQRKIIAQKAHKWYGICLSPNNLSLKFCLLLLGDMSGSNLNSSAIQGESQSHVGDFSGKFGRNDPCPCGSGLKYKKCCLDKMKKI